MLQKNHWPPAHGSSPSMCSRGVHGAEAQLRGAALQGSRPGEPVIMQGTPGCHRQACPGLARLCRGPVHEYVRLGAQVCMGCVHAACLRARQPVDAEQVAISGLHCVLLQRIPLWVHQRCAQLWAACLQGQQQAGTRGLRPAAIKGAPDMGGSAGSFGWGKELWHVARCFALTDSITAAASSACSILAGIGGLRRARGSSLTALSARQVT
jgi:hypothetical protein